MKNTYKIQIAVAAGLIFLICFQSCNIKEPTAPVWDVSVNMPITNKNYTLYDILEKKSGSVSHFTEGSQKNLLYYSQNNNIEKIGFSGKINVEPFSASSSESIGDIKINNETVNSDVGYDWLNSSVSAGSSEVIPPVSNASSSTNLSVATQFQYLKVKSGAVDITFKNYFPSPVVITINSFTVRDAVSGAAIIQSTAPVVIQPGQTSAAQSFQIAEGTTINNRLNLEFVISTNGSGGQKITIPQHSVSVGVLIRDLTVSEANAIIPQQNTIKVDNSVTIDQNSSQPSLIQNVKLDGGTLNGTVTNNFNVSITATFIINNLKTPQGATFSFSKTLSPKSTANIFQNMSLVGYSLVSETGSPTNTVTYHVNADVVPTNNYVSISGTDNVSASMNVSNLSVSEFTGRLKPTTIDQKRTAMSLNLKDVQNKLQFAKLNLKNPQIELHLRPTAQVSFSVNGKIFAHNSRGEKNTMSLSSRTMSSTIISPADSVITLNADSVSKFLSSFTQLPDSLIVYAGGVVNPNYDIVSVKKTDEVTGNGVMQIPFQFALNGGVFNDSVKVDLSKDDRDLIKDDNWAETVLNFTNAIAADVGFTGKLFDKNNNFLMYFPPKYQDQDTVVNIGGATTDANGNVSSPNVQTVNVKLLQGDPAKLADAEYMRVYLKFSTTGTQPVNFKTSDYIKISAFGSTNYHVHSK